ncbi:50S ribosomal protein L32 [Candidatus Berkelbacteria bacterium CG_4_9_14_0_2_um_filter_42_30]|uniref:Large ribosomal subunit protein bL32 n=6 Tax=Candidatus Berkelbacteria TaxID=1618330 RepID=A0A2M7K1M4_9BACT|nr:MAG: 50S ribosomal protein L32 [Candidatus Berkelbacteria bacterium CG1_02_42_45]PIP50749.1 MAG: 50S ribosomal protein L32 [Candidatus Berkelbacteria bacterium CG23_combo_of_CG06-09_8_20_14_all_41_73]PIR27569.1 MAG: 50S ribosomal protein L32 [Candidatus Berkelbacteria bacterium CG11_big_fil_rev_8_21_14_0_20_42_15]PIX30140.1 MAG: 50S ribosomal protein L32 [Candidatus Berkelbacteria bacterium CG_4_8_14_3_um_filter_42_13]PIZ27677.1 MAG: 50S ribosomal protein L32 [Candidatus Berkelbacteria bacte
MAEPKKKSSRSRTARRRHQLRVKSFSHIFCEKCHEPKLPHHVCYNCGTYRGKKVIDFEQKGKEKTEAMVKADQKTK